MCRPVTGRATQGIGSGASGPGPALPSVLGDDREAGGVEGEGDGIAGRAGVGHVLGDDEEVLWETLNGNLVFHVAAEIGGFGDAAGEAAGFAQADGVGADGEFGGAVGGAAVGEGEGEAGEGGGGEVVVEAAQGDGTRFASPMKSAMKRLAGCS